ncbi:MAG TPA: hypothetical protein VFZ17_13660 [Acidimicrobiia bacterium]|nr:hypothetical protein [Acidimicrobiia bacterium]
MGGTMVVSGRSRGARVALVGFVAVVLATSALFVGPAGAAKSAASGSCPDPSGSIKLGVSYFGSVATNVGDLGADTATLPADQAIIDGYKSGAAALNAAGGVAGCQVEVVPFNFSARSSDFNQTSQQECAAFTQDTKVFAVYSTAYETKVAVDCFAKAKTPMFQISTNYPPTCADAKKYAGYVYTPAGIYTCRWGSFIDIYKQNGLFPKDAKVGILVHDDGSGQGKALADDVWGPKLKKLKIPYETFSFTGATNEATFANVNSAAGNAILKFKADGVNVVLFTPSGGQGAVAFMPQAKTQSFFPNYGLDIYDGLGIASSLGADAIKTGVAVSWAISDLPLTAQQELPANPAIEACASWAMPNPAGLTGSSPYCDFLSILQASMKGATKVDAATLQKGIAALGTSWLSSTTYDGATKFVKARADGGDKVRVLKYDPTAKAWESVSDKLTTIP